MLFELISRQPKAGTKALLMRHTLATTVPNKRKAELAKLLMTYVLEDPEARYH